MDIATGVHVASVSTIGRWWSTRFLDTAEASQYHRLFVSGRGLHWPCCYPSQLPSRQPRRPERMDPVDDNAVYRHCYLNSSGLWDPAREMEACQARPPRVICY
jgi:hypothetical protein